MIGAYTNAGYSFCVAATERFPRFHGTKPKPIKRNNLICVKQILWYIRFTVGAAIICESVFECGL